MSTQNVVLLTGATGFIGFRTLALLLEQGWKVRCAVRTVAGFEEIKALNSAASYASQLEYILVPNITIPGAYDEAIKGVTYVIHTASPFADPAVMSSEEYEASYIQPAISGTIGMLESASKEPQVKRVIITASALSITSLIDFTKPICINETTRTGSSKGPWNFWLEAYASSKVAALEATKEWQMKNTHYFDVINIAPVFVIGRDETATNVASFLKGSNDFVLSSALGRSSSPSAGAQVHVDDVAAMHVQALDPSIPGNEDYLSSGEPAQWSEAAEIVKKFFPKECADGIFNFEGTAITTPMTVDNSKAKRVFGIQFKTFEEQVRSAAGQYVELIKQAA